MLDDFLLIKLLMISTLLNTLHLRNPECAHIARYHRVLTAIEAILLPHLPRLRHVVRIELVEVELHLDLHLKSRIHRPSHLSKPQVCPAEMLSTQET